MIRTIIENEQEKIEISHELLKVIEEVIKTALEYENCEFDTEVSVTITDNENIREINKQMRDIDKATDVLSFPILYFDENGDIIDSDYDEDDGYMLLGDIVISAERAAEQAKEYGHSLKREIAFLTAHSMLHLLGYDHVDDPEGERIMFSKQEEILNILGITREV